jgi:hypothetical protein
MTKEERESGSVRVNSEILTQLKNEKAQNSGLKKTRHKKNLSPRTLKNMHLR